MAIHIDEDGMYIENAIIENTKLQFCGDYPTFYVYLKGNGWGGGFGGYSLVGYNTDPPTYGTVEPLLRVCEVVGVNKWEELIGKYVRVKMDSFSVKVIGNIIKDEWFDLKEFYKEK